MPSLIPSMTTKATASAGTDGVRVARVLGDDLEARRVDDEAHVVRVDRVEGKLSLAPEAALDGQGPLISRESDESLAQGRRREQAEGEREQAESQYALGVTGFGLLGLDKERVRGLVGGRERNRAFGHWIYHFV